MKNELETNFVICGQMMMWRNVALVFGIPFAWCLLSSFAFGQLSFVNFNPIWLLCIAFAPQPPMLINLFRLANKMHGEVYASLHVVLTVILTPAFLAGPLLIPLLVQGDARRLLLDDDSGK